MQRPPRKTIVSGAPMAWLREQVGYEIAKRFGVSQATVSEIKHNKMWKH